MTATATFTPWHVFDELKGDYLGTVAATSEGMAKSLAHHFWGDKPVRTSVRPGRGGCCVACGCEFKVDIPQGRANSAAAVRKLLSVCPECDAMADEDN